MNMSMKNYLLWIKTKGLFSFKQYCQFGKSTLYLYENNKVRYEKGTVCTQIK